MRVELSRNTETPMPVPNTRVSMFSARMRLMASASISTWRNSAGVCSHVRRKSFACSPDLSWPISASRLWIFFIAASC